MRRAKLVSLNKAILRLSLIMNCDLRETDGIRSQENDARKTGQSEQANDPDNLW